MTLTGQTFFKDGDAWVVELYGPVTCLCKSIEEPSMLFRFETDDVITCLIKTHEVPNAA